MIVCHFKSPTQQINILNETAFDGRRVECVTLKCSTIKGSYAFAVSNENHFLISQSETKAPISTLFFIL